MLGIARNSLCLVGRSFHISDSLKAACLASGPGLCVIEQRHLHSLRFCSNLEIFPATGTRISAPPKGYEVLTNNSNHERPLTLLFCWLMAKDRHVRKYLQLYTNMGFDVLKVKLSPLELLRPTKGSHIANDTSQHGELLNRFVGQIWDSAVDIDGIPTGLPRALTLNRVLQDYLKKYLEWYLKIQYKSATVHYQRSSDAMHSCVLNVPGLFLHSKTDPISSPRMNANVYKKWEAKGIPIFVKCWDKSPHVGHYLHHEEEYEEEVLAFLDRIGLTRESVRSESAFLGP